MKGCGYLTVFYYSIFDVDTLGQEWDHREFRKVIIYVLEVVVLKDDCEIFEVLLVDMNQSRTPRIRMIDKLIISNCNSLLHWKVYKIVVGLNLKERCQWFTVDKCVVLIKIIVDVGKLLFTIQVYWSRNDAIISWYPIGINEFIISECDIKWLPDTYKSIETTLILPSEFIIIPYLVEANTFNTELVTVFKP